MVNKDNIPEHIAIIMDGNGRWAKERGLSRTAGHRAGVERVKEIVGAAQKLSIKVITFFTFSTENWQRPRKEINMLMRFLDNFLDKQINELDKNNIRLIIIGQDEPLPKYLRIKINDAQDRTKNNSGLTVVLALNYGSRQEIIDTVKRIVDSVIAGQIKIDELNENEFSRHLYTAGLPDPDLLIRTSGELRLSNFLLWQLSYAELYFPKIYWPDFGKDALKKAIEVYQDRNRRFGRTC
jgi:undecaprenyl diphosphate synthase